MFEKKNGTSYQSGTVCQDSSTVEPFSIISQKKVENGTTFQKVELFWLHSGTKTVPLWSRFSKKNVKNVTTIWFFVSLPDPPAEDLARKHIDISQILVRYVPKSKLTLSHGVLWGYVIVDS